MPHPPRTPLQIALGLLLMPACGYLGFLWFEAHLPAARFAARPSVPPQTVTSTGPVPIFVSRSRSGTFERAGSFERR